MYFQGRQLNQKCFALIVNRNLLSIEANSSLYGVDSFLEESWYTGMLTIKLSPFEKKWAEKHTECIHSVQIKVLLHGKNCGRICSLWEKIPWKLRYFLTHRKQLFENQCELDNVWIPILLHEVKLTEAFCDYFCYSSGIILDQIQHNLFIAPLLRSKAESVLVKQLCCSQTKMDRWYRKMIIYGHSAIYMQLPSSNLSFRTDHFWQRKQKHLWQSCLPCNCINPLYSYTY